MVLTSLGNLVLNKEKKQTWVFSAFSAETQKFCRLHVRNFQSKIACLLCASYVHVFDSLCLNRWCSIRLSEGYFIAKYKKFPGWITYFARFASISAFFTSMLTQVWKGLNRILEEGNKGRERDTTPWEHCWKTLSVIMNLALWFILSLVSPEALLVVGVVG